MSRNQQPYRRSTRKLPRLKPRLILCFLPLLLLYIMLLLRAASLQLLPHAKLTQFMQRTEPSSMIITPPARGMILDRHGRELAINVSAPSAYIDPTIFTKQPQWRRNLGKVALMTSQPYHALLSKLSNASRFFWVKRHLSPTEAAKLRQLQVAGLKLVDESHRQYPNGTLAAHLLGFTNIDGVGVEGLEYTYNHWLQGSAGKLIGQKDAKGRRLIVGGIENSGTTGSNVSITIDSVLQYMVERELTRAIEETKSQGAMGIIMQPQTGEILALAIQPTFDPNRYQDYPKERWRNRLVSDIFEPGSTFKSLVIAYGLERGVLRKNDRFYCKPASLVVGNKVINETHKDLLWLNTQEVLKYSSNIGAARIALQIGSQNMSGLLNDFGFGEKTGVDLPGETAGLLLPLNRWTQVDLAAAGYGQGMGVTPLQMLRAYSALINGGELLRPYISLKVEDKNLNHTTMLGNKTTQKHPLSEATSKQIRTMLSGVVEEHGTGSLAAMSEYRVGGKTGTAQRFDAKQASYLKDNYISSFIGYLPLENPQLLMMVIMEQPQGVLNSGGMVAAPVFRRIAEQAAQVLHIEPDTQLNQNVMADIGRLKGLGSGIMQKTAIQTEAMLIKKFDGTAKVEFKERFKGMTVRQAMQTARKLGYEVVVKGSGFATGKVEKDLRQPNKLYVEFERLGKRKY